MRIELTEEQWRQVLACLAETPWKVSNGLIMAIGAQMQAQTPAAQAGFGGLSRGNSGDVPDELVNQAGPSRQ